MILCDVLTLQNLQPTYVCMADARRDSHCAQVLKQQLFAFISILAGSLMQAHNLMVSKTIC